MKHVKFLILFTLLCNMLHAQVPKSFNYQAVARDASGNVLANKTVALRLSILDVSATGTALYIETQNPTTNQFGLFSIQIGGVVQSGVFANVNWAANSKFLKVEMDGNNGTTYSLVGTSQLLSVPYALQSDNTAKIQGQPISTTPPTVGQMLMWNGTSWIPVSNPAGSGNGSNSATLLYLSNF